MAQNKTDHVVKTDGPAFKDDLTREARQHRKPKLSTTTQNLYVFKNKNTKDIQNTVYIRERIWKLQERKV